MSKISTVGIFAPSSALKPGEDEFLEAGIKLLSDWGLKVIRADNLYDREELFDGAGMWLAGSPQTRIDNLLKLWSNPNIDVLIAQRGGYGAIQIISDLDYNYLAKNPKPIIGYSDITTLFIALTQKAYRQKRHQLYHAPMVIELTRLQNAEITAYIKLLSQIDPELYRQGFLDLGPDFNGTRSQVNGGNLTLISSLIGTEFQLKTDSQILFLEDCKEDAYKLDRMSHQLELAGYFDKIEELWLGEGLEAEFNIQYFQALAQKKSFRLKLNTPNGHKSKMPIILN